MKRFCFTCLVLFPLLTSVFAHTAMLQDKPGNRTHLTAEKELVLRDKPGNRT